MMRVLKFATLSLFALALSVAQASTITSAIVYENTPDPLNAADPANQGATLASASFTIGALGIDFTSPSSPYTIAGFLNNPTFSNEVNGFNPNGSADNLELVITGTVTLNAGANSFVLGHDDGAVLNIAGFGNVVNAPGPSSFSNSPFTVTALTAGDYAFTLEYNECCGPPADLLWNINGTTVGGGSVPEPASLALLGSGLVGLYGVARRRFSKV